VWDLIKLGDHLSERDDIDPCRIGITGESLGGIADHDVNFILNKIINFIN
jgi:predicted peptidase